MKNPVWRFVLLSASMLLLASCGTGANSSSTSSSVPPTSASSSSEPASSEGSSVPSSSEAMKYTVTFLDYDESFISTVEVKEGETAVYSGPTRVRPATAQYTYTFTGWDKDLTNVHSSFSTKAQYSSSVNKYTIIWNNWDGSLLEKDEGVEYGTMPSFDQDTNPSKASSAQYSYSFNGWSPTVTSVVGNATYTATFAETTRKYTITWINSDGTVLETDEDVAYGVAPKYNGTKPIKTGDAQYSYSFSAWSPEIVAVVGDATYTATFTESTNTYAVTWKNSDGTILETDSAVAYGTIPTYDGTTPTKAKTSQYSYTFSGWTPKVAAVTSEAIYTATFSEKDDLLIYEFEDNEYSVVGINDGGIDVVVPETYDDGIHGVHPVTAIGNKVFTATTTTIKSLKLGDNLETIEDNAFGFLSLLDSVSVGNNIKYIGSTILAYSKIEKDFAASSDTDLYLTSRDGSTKYLIKTKSTEASFSFDDKTAVVAGEVFLGNTNLTSITLTDGIKTLGPSCFQGCTSLTSVTLGDSLETIGEMAFYRCTSLNEIKVGNGLKTIHQQAFDYTPFYTTTTNWVDDILYLHSSSVSNPVDYLIEAKSTVVSVVTNENTRLIADNAIRTFDDVLTSITLNSSLLYLGYESLSFNAGITSLVIPDGVESLPESLLINSDALTSLTLPANLKYIGKNALGGCGALTSIELPSKLEIISNGALSDCGLTSVSLPSSIVLIGESAFSSCSSLASITIDEGNEYYHVAGNCLIGSVSGVLINGTNDSVIPNDGSVKVIGAEAFKDLSSLASVSVPDSVTKIERDAFRGCEKLATLTLGKSLNSIGENAFYGCELIAKVDLPDALERVESGAFDECVALATVTAGNNITFLSRVAFNGTALLTDFLASSEPVLYITSRDGTIDYLHRGNSNLVDAEASLKSTTKILKDSGGPFNGCENFKKVSMADTSITELADSMFYSCSALTEVVLPSSLKTVSENAFGNCTGLTSITLPTSITSIERGAFFKSGLTAIAIPETVTSLGNDVFYNCASLKTANIPSNIVTLEQDMFSGCEKLESIALPTGLKTIDVYCFYKCKALTEISLPVGLLTIGNRVFYGCTGLTSVIIPTSITNIGDTAFGGYENAINIYCLSTEKPAGWNDTWADDSAKAYWYSETSNTDGSHWRYVGETPTVWQA